MPPLVAKAQSGNYIPPPQGLYNAACCDVVDLGRLMTNWGEKHKIKIVFQTEDVCAETKRPYVIGKKYTFSLHKNSLLRRDLELWRGRAFTEEEVAAGFDLERLLNANAQIQVLHQMGQDGMYAMIAAIMAPAKGVTPIKVAGYTRQPWATEKAPQSAAKAGPKNDEEVPF